MTTTLDRRHFLGGAFCALTALALPGCGSEAEPIPTEKVYIDEDDIDEMFSDPDEFKGMWVKLRGKVSGHSERIGGLVTFKAYYDVTNYERAYVVTCDTDETYHDGDYVTVDGKIEGMPADESDYAYSLSDPIISNAFVRESSYVESVVPALKTIEPGAYVIQNNITFACDKVEYAETETRVYVRIDNNGEANIHCGSYSIRILLGGRQIEQSSNYTSVYEGDYPELSNEVSVGATSSGIALFPAIDPNSDFTLVFPNIYSDDYEEEFVDVQLPITT